MMWLLAATLVLAPTADADQWRLTSTANASWTIDGASVGDTGPGTALVVPQATRFAARGPNDIDWSAMVRPAPSGNVTTIEPAWIAHHRALPDVPAHTAIPAPNAGLLLPISLLALGAARAKHP